jgi:hypothetical protein
MRIETGELIGKVLKKRGSMLLALPLVAQGPRWAIDNSAWLRATAGAIQAGRVPRANDDTRRGFEP